MTVCTRTYRPLATIAAALVCVSCVLWWSSTFGEKPSQGLTPIPADIQIIEKIGQKVPVQLPFVREDGTTTSLQAYLDKGQPLLLVPVYYSCPLLCNITLNRLIDTLKEVSWVPGNGYQVVTFSIDSREDATLAKKKKTSKVAPATA